MSEATRPDQGITTEAAIQREATPVALLWDGGLRPRDARLLRHPNRTEAHLCGMPERCVACRGWLRPAHIVGVAKRGDGTGLGYLCGTCFHRRDEQLRGAR